MAAPAPTVTTSTVRRIVIDFSTLFLFWVHFHCQYLLTEAQVPHEAGDVFNLDSESRHDWPWTSSEPGAADDLGAFKLAVGASSRKASRVGGSLTRRVVIRYDGMTTSRRLEVETLTAFKAAITDDPLGVLTTWRSNDTDSCGWTGVVCSPHYPHHLIGINLNGGQLVGNLDSALQEVGNLPFLQRLDLSANVFTGSIPGASLANCSNLMYMNLSTNQLSGAIPFQLGELVNLKTLDFNGNNLTSEIPVSLGNCTLLRALDLGSNFLDGDIPSVLGRLSSLEVLNLGSSSSASYEFLPVGTNSFSGTLPPALGNCTSLTYLDLTLNSNLGGELPPELSRLKSLQQIWMSFCSFRGAVPTWLGNFTVLSELHMSTNLFRGEIPDELGRLQNLTLLTLGGNNLTGVIPISITNCTKLVEFALESNINLTGAIPPQLGFLTSLQILSLAENSFTGVIPSSTVNCSALTVLELGPNPFHPQIIPSWIGSLSSLSDIDFNNMNLEGNIPQEIGRLSSLDTVVLDGNKVTGVIPSSLGNCTLMTVIEFGFNRLIGEIPSEMGLLTSLNTLVLATNFLSGPLPKFIANFTQITHLDVTSNSLSGTIDGDFGSLSQLQTVFADNNHFGGPFPETLSNCSNLIHISLSINNLTGGLPSSLGNLTRLEQLSLGDNQFKGTIPVDVTMCSKLGLLSLEDNKLDGSILPGIGQLSSLQYLYLAHNNFTGVIPTSLGNCSNIDFLDLSYNQFQGSVPGSIFVSMSGSLTSLNLSNNFFSGSWPSKLGQLTNLQILDVSSNNISGSIPDSIGSLNALIRLDVSNNNFTGAIPPSLGVLPLLDFFNASYNNFQGFIPDSGVFEKVNLTNSSFLGNPGLCGTLLGPHRECPAAPSPSGTHNVTSGKSGCDSEGFNCSKVWIPTACAAVGFLVIATAALCWVKTRLSAAAKRRSNEKHLMLNFPGSHMRISERDVMQVLDGDRKNVIGMGAKSVVYKGVLSEGEIFAIKLLPSSYGEDEEECDTDDHGQREMELLHEVHILSRLRHRNILKVLSFCSTLDVKAIILEYMPQGSLHEHLYPIRTEGDQSTVCSCQLTWQARFNIAVGIAEGMLYLHDGLPEPLVHRDLKPSNVLLDANLDPKVGDFGLSKFANRTKAGEATASAVWGTIGYMPPEYATGTSVSTKGDVYSYGIVLLEVVIGKSPTSRDSFGPDGNLREWVTELFQRAPMELLDPTLMREGTQDSVKKEQMMLLIRVPLFCTRETPHNRPSMSDVVAMLTQIKELGLVPIPPRSIEDLASEICIWTSEHPNDANLPSF